MSKKPNKKVYISIEQADSFEVVLPLLKAIYNEFQELSKKKPQEIVSPPKVKMVNRILAPILEILEDEPTRPFLNLLNEDELPQNSDSVLMLGQAVTAMQSFKSKYYDHRTGWKVGS
jgi:hypothetical protein